MVYNIYPTYCRFTARILYYFLKCSQYSGEKLSYYYYFNYYQYITTASQLHSTETYPSQVA